jgi:hypothetical protein
MGHNYGANHTHRFGWPVGPIDNCTTIEGPCSGYQNNTTAQIGTLIIYCNQNGDVTLEFHEIVKDNAIIAGIANSSSCIGDCNSLEVSCGDPCPGDLNAYGLVNVHDIMIILTYYNCISNYVDDMNDEGTVNLDDVLAIFAVYGNDCQF